MNLNEKVFFSSLSLSLVDEENKQKGFFSLHCAQFMRLFDVVDILDEYCQSRWVGISDWNLSTKSKIFYAIMATLFI